MQIKKYKSSESFRIALIERLKTISLKNKVDINQLQRQVAFDRFLCRLFYKDDLPLFLKGGYALEMRFENSRWTKDLDLALRDLKLLGITTGEDQDKKVYSLLKEIVAFDLQDFFVFSVEESSKDLERPPYGGHRFNVNTSIGGRPFIRFHVDIGIGDAWIPPHEKVELNNWLDFIGAQTVKVPVISKEQHFAEKIHAYVVQRPVENSRVKDLIDLVILVQDGDLNHEMAIEAIALTFKKMKCDPPPSELKAPSDEWTLPFSRLSKQCHLIMDIENGFLKVNSFYQIG